jgi:hypothetical protein
MIRTIALWLVITTGILWAQEPAKPPAKPDAKSDLAILEAAYKADMGDIAADYEKWAEALQKWYLGALDKLGGERVKSGDLEGALAFKSERERIAARAETTPEQTQAMPASLAKLRAAYEPELKKIVDEAGRRKDAARGKHIGRLDALQKRLTMAGDIDDAVLVRAEKDQIASEMAASAAVRAPKQAEIPPLPPVASSPKPRASPEPPAPADLLDDSADFSLSGTGVTIATLSTGSKAFSNRNYVWQKVPADLEGRRYTQPAGGVPPHLIVRAKRDAVVEVITAIAIDQSGFRLPGWDRPGTPFSYSDAKQSRMVLARKRLKAGEELLIPQGNWSGVLVLLPK